MRRYSQGYLSVGSSRLFQFTRGSRFFNSGCSSTARTTRKPTKSASVIHQMLCGRCASWRNQVLSEPRRAPVREFHVGGHAHGPVEQLGGEVGVVFVRIMIEAPLGDVAVHVVQAPGIR